MAIPPVIGDIKHSEALGSLHKEKPKKVGAFRAIWFHPDGSGKHPLLLPVRAIQSIVAAIGLAVYGAGICAAWALPGAAGALVGTFTLPLFSMIGLMRGSVRDGIKFGYMGGASLGGLFGAPLAYGLCSVGNGITALATGGRSVKQLYAVNSPKTFAVFSFVFPTNIYTQDSSLGLREDRKITFDKMVKPVVKLNRGAYKKWEENLEAELKEKKESLLQRTKEGNIGRYREIYRTYFEIHKKGGIAFSQDELKEFYEIRKVVEEYESKLRDISIVPGHGLGWLILAITRDLDKGEQNKVDETLALITKSYEGALESLEKVENLLPNFDKLCKEFVDRIAPIIEEAQG